MNYTIGVEEVDRAALLIALGYECTDYTITTSVDLNSAVAQKRAKTASYTFSDYSKGCQEFGTAQKVLEGYKFPDKGQSIANTLQAAKLAAHNYQVLKSVILHNEPLQQIVGNGYVMLKNANGESVPKSDEGLLLSHGSSDLAAIAIAAALGCKVASYSLQAGSLSVFMTASSNGITLAMIEGEKDNPTTLAEDNYSLLSVLVATFLNREELIKAIYAKQQVMLMRGSKSAIFSTNADEQLKKRILKELNA